MAAQIYRKRAIQRIIKQSWGAQREASHCWLEENKTSTGTLPKPSFGHSDGVDAVRRRSSFTHQALNILQRIFS
jgi:hypothetical protein